MSAPVVASGTRRSRGAGVRVLPTLTEWQTRTFPGIALTENDRMLARSLGTSHDNRLQVEELREGLRVRSRSWVGVVRLETVEIRVAPKLSGDHLGLVHLLEFASGLDSLWKPRGDATLDVAGTSLIDLVALLFANACEGVVRRGLLCGYVEREEDLPMVRGRILADRQVLERFGRLDRIICRFDELEHDVPENRLIAATLALASRRVSSPAVHRRISRMRAVFDPICDPAGLDLKSLRGSLTFNRLNAHYEVALELAWLLLDGFGIDDLLQPGSTRSFAFLLDMNLLFERFVHQMVRRVLPAREYRVEYQSSHGSVVWNATARRSYMRVIPDLLVAPRGLPGQRLAIDAKYKLYDERRVDPADVYQTFLYAYALGSQGPETVPKSMILYPVSDESSSEMRLRVRPLRPQGGAEITVLGVPIPTVLGELRSGEPGAACFAVRDAICGKLESVGSDHKRKAS